MKFKTTKKAILNSNKPCFKIAYCKAQELLRFNDPIAYYCTYNGWQCDIYELDNCYISTGYGPFGAAPTYETIEAYNNKALTVQCDITLSYDQIKETTISLLNEFINKCLMEVK